MPESGVKCQREHRAALEHIVDTLTVVQRFLLHLVFKINLEHHALLSRLKDDMCVCVRTHGVVTKLTRSNI